MYTVVGKAVLSGENKSGQPFSYNKVFCLTDSPTSAYNMTRCEGEFVTTLNAQSGLFNDLAVGQSFKNVFYDKEGFVALVSD